MVMWGFEWREIWGCCEASVAEAPEQACKLLACQNNAEQEYVMGQSGVPCAIRQESSDNENPAVQRESRDKPITCKKAGVDIATPVEQ